jgi:hypothetical protein
MLQPKILQVTPLEDYKLLIRYESDEDYIFDVTPYISGDWYSELKDKSYFTTVHVIDDGHGIVWENGQDISPHELYENSKKV